MAPSKPAAGDGTAALDKALDVLDAVGAAPLGLGQNELAEQLGLPRTTLYRLLATLVARGLLRRDPLRRVYCLGFRCFEYARAAYAMPDLAAAAGVELRSLRDLTGETSYLSVLDGLAVLSLDRCDGAHAQRSHSVVGQCKPLHCTSQGKAMLAAMPAERRDAIVRDLKLEAVTPRSLTDRRRLQVELKLTATRGYAIDDEEIILGVRCVGAPIVDPDGQVRGAISVAGPAFRLTMARLALLGPEVAQAARRIGAQLGAARPRELDQSQARPVPGSWAFHGAFALWDAAQNRLLWVDTLGPALHASDGQRNTVLQTLDAPIDALLQLDDGSLALATRGNGWQRIDPTGQRLPWTGPGRRAQALTVRPARPGPATDPARPGGALWGCQPDGERWRLGELIGGDVMHGGWAIGESVGALAWSADGQQLFAIAPDSGTIYAMREGQAGLRRLATVPKGSGRLSGLALDAEGGVWAALADGWSLMRFAADGELDRVVGLPVPRPTDLAFGGPDHRTLFITSARDGLAMDVLASAPASGQLLALDVGIAGVTVPPTRFAPGGLRPSVQDDDN